MVVGHVHGFCSCSPGSYLLLHLLLKLARKFGMIQLVGVESNCQWHRMQVHSQLYHSDESHQVQTCSKGMSLADRTTFV
jgi:hypothetical protein